MSLGITILGGGSRGNSLLIHNDNDGILVDAGFSRKEMLRRMVRAGVDPAIIRLILVTHEHGDHTSGCRVLGKHLGVPVCASFKTFEYMRYERSEDWGDTRIFSTGSSFEFNKFQIHPFSVQHDAIDPVGFVISSGEYRVGIATDLGCVNELTKRRLHDCDVLILESNYDLDMLRSADRSLSLKRRIMGRHGHLDNAEAASSLPELLTARTRALFMTHISSDCNTPSIVKKTIEEKLKEMGRTDIILSIVSQDEPNETLWI